jgi:hypothetical protein
MGQYNAKENGTAREVQFEPLPAAKAPSLASDLVDFVVAVLDFFAEGTHAEEFVAAGDAAESRNAQGPPQGSGKAIGEIASDALDFNIAANRTVRHERVCKWCGARAKTPRASRTPPRHAADDTSEVVEKSSSARPAAFGRITNRANHEGLTPPGLEKSLRYAMGIRAGKQGGIEAA